MYLQTLMGLKKEENEQTILHLSEHMKFFSLRLAEGRVRECSMNVPPEVIFQAVEGSGTIFLNEEPFAMKAGDLLLCPSGKHHRLAANQGETFGLLVFLPLKQQ